MGGGAQVLTFADIEGGETFGAALLGSAEEVVEERVADDDVILIKGAKSSRPVGALKLDFPLPCVFCTDFLDIFYSGFLYLFQIVPRI